MPPLTLRRLFQALAVSLLVAATFAGLWFAAHPQPRLLDARVTEVAAGLRCPSCAGQSVAASQSDLAREMRQVTAQQLAAGRSPAEVRIWFAERYGDAVLLDPPPTGAGLVAQLAPFALLAVGGVAIARLVGGRRGLLLGAVLVTGLGSVFVVTGGLGLSHPVAGGPWSPTQATVSPYPSPTRASSASRKALAALQEGRLDDAERQARQALASAAGGSREQQDALLVLGLAQRQRGDPAAAQTLLRFLHMAPNHPAALMVRRLLEGG